MRVLLKGIVPPPISHIKFVTRAYRTDFSEHIHTFKAHENLLNASNFEYSSPKSAQTVNPRPHMGGCHPPSRFCELYATFLKLEI